jgi:putative ATPase
MAIRNAPTELMKDAGYGHGYRYAHDDEGAVSNLECLPSELAGARFYHPTEYGWEQRIRERMSEIQRLRQRNRSRE